MFTGDRKMTDEELLAEEHICDGKCQDDITKNYVHCKTCTRIKDFLAGLKAGRPQWHDLRKDPNDLPKEDRYYLIYTVLGNYYVSKHHHNTNYWIGIQNQFVSIKQVIAWCETPKFKE